MEGRIVKCINNKSPLRIVYNVTIGKYYKVEAPSNSNYINSIWIVDDVGDHRQYRANWFAILPDTPASRILYESQ